MGVCCFTDGEGVWRAVESLGRSIRGGTTSVSEKLLDRDFTV